MVPVSYATRVQGRGDGLSKLLFSVLGAEEWLPLSLAFCGVLLRKLEVGVTAQGLLILWLGRFI